MPRPRNESPRVLGPYYLKGKGLWQVSTVDPRADGGKGGRSDSYFGEEEEAWKWRRKVEGKLQLLNGTTVSEALDQYEVQLKQKPYSKTETMRRLRLFFKPVLEMQLARLKLDRCKQLYEAFREGKSADYHLGTLCYARTFGKWCVKREMIAANPLADVEGEGKRKAGKPQFTGDESRKFYSTALHMARQGDDGALGAAMLITMGLRQGEVCRRRVRDLDLDGTVLRIENAKTPKGNRIVGVPEELQPLLRDLTEDRAPFQILFEAANGGEHTKAWQIAAVKRVCARAGLHYVCPHGLRGTHATLGVKIGIAPQEVADALGHESVRTTTRHYADPGAVAEAQAGAAMRVIAGGKR